MEKVKTGSSDLEYLAKEMFHHGAQHAVVRQVDMIYIVHIITINLLILKPGCLPQQSNESRSCIHRLTWSINSVLQEQHSSSG